MHAGRAGYEPAAPLRRCAVVGVGLHPDALGGLAHARYSFERWQRDAGLPCVCTCRPLSPSLFISLAHVCLSVWPVSAAHSLACRAVWGQRQLPGGTVPSSGPCRGSILCPSCVQGPAELLGQAVLGVARLPNSQRALLGCEWASLLALQVCGPQAPRLVLSCCGAGCRHCSCSLSSSAGWCWAPHPCRVHPGHLSRARTG